MLITINDQEKSFNEKSISIKELLKSLNILSDNGIAVAVNQTVIKKIDWENFMVKDNDKLLLITATQGG